MTALRFRPGHNELITAGTDGHVRLWQEGKRITLRDLAAHGTFVTALAVGPAGRVVASGGAKGVIRLWDLDDGVEQASVSAHDGPVGALAYSRDGRLLASHAWDGQLRVWEMHQGQVRPRATLPAPSSAPEHTLNFDESGNIWCLAKLTNGQHVMAWSLVDTQGGFTFRRAPDKDAVSRPAGANADAVDPEYWRLRVRERLGPPPPKPAR